DLRSKPTLDLEAQPAPPGHLLAEVQEDAERVVDVELESVDVTHAEVVLVELLVVGPVDRQLQRAEELGRRPQVAQVELDAGREGERARPALVGRGAEVLLEA